MSRKSPHARSPTGSRSPGGMSGYRNDMTDADAYEDARAVDLSIANMRMTFDQSVDMSVEEEHKSSIDNSRYIPEQSSRFLKPIVEEQDEDENKDR